MSLTAACLSSNSQEALQASEEAAGRWQSAGDDSVRAELFDEKAQRHAHLYQRNIEAYVGTIRLPVGLAGPLCVHGAAGTREYRVPLATTEAALVASYNRGARLITAAGGCTARVVNHGVSRTPVFVFRSVTDAVSFSNFLVQDVPHLHEVVAAATSHGRLLAVDPQVEGNALYVDFRYASGDASGQNMVTFITEAVCQSLLARAPVQPRHWFLEANFSGDKKASAKSLASVRGRRVVAEVTIAAALVETGLHTSAQHVIDYWYAGVVGGAMSGTTGLHGHIANGLAALYLATGQDVACVAESATGITRMELTEHGDLYASVTLPNVMVGTVGGGTGLPSARACLDLLGLAGKGQADHLAELCAATVLGGELSIVGALCSGDFARAHRCLSRGEHMCGRSQ